MLWQCDGRTQHRAARRVWATVEAKGPVTVSLAAGRPAGVARLHREVQRDARRRAGAVQRAGLSSEKARPIRMEQRASPRGHFRTRRRQVMYDVHVSPPVVLCNPLRCSQVNGVTETGHLGLVE